MSRDGYVHEASSRNAGLHQFFSCLPSCLEVAGRSGSHMQEVQAGGCEEVLFDTRLPTSCYFVHLPTSWSVK